MSGTPDRIIEAVQRLVRPLLSRIDYLALYSARVVSQAADGTLDVVPDDPRVAGLTRVPLRTFVPGVEVRVKPEGRVLVGFEAGDPRKPIATLFDGGAIESLKITATTKIEVSAPEVGLVSAGGLPAARQGDVVASGGAAPFTMVIAAPVTIPGVGVIPPGTPIVVTFPLPLYGLVASGNPGVRE